MHEKTRLAQNSHMNIVNVGIDVLTHLGKKKKKYPALNLTCCPIQPHLELPEL